MLVAREGCGRSGLHLNIVSRHACSGTTTSMSSPPSSALASTTFGADSVVNSW